MTKLTEVQIFKEKNNQIYSKTFCLLIFKKILDFHPFMTYMAY